MAGTAIYPSLRGKAVLITGGAEGIAASAVELFCRQGSNVVFGDIAKDSAARLVSKVQSLQQEDLTLPWTVPEFFECDVTNLELLKKLAEHVKGRFGRIDVLVNSAAAAGASSRVPSIEVTEESWTKDINLNLR